MGNLAQKQVEGKNQNFFFNYVKEKITSLKQKEQLLSVLEQLVAKTKQTYLIPFTREEFEILGILCFLVGQDYYGQAYQRKEILTNVLARFKELEITEEEFNLFDTILNGIKDKENFLIDYMSEPIDYMKNHVKEHISVKPEEKLTLKNLKAKLNRFLDIAIIPIGYSLGLSELRKEDLTYENLLKINSLLQEQSTFSGSNVSKLTAVYSDPLFDSLLKRSIDVLNEAKYALLYEESILSTAGTFNRFPLVINPDFYTDDQYAEFKESWESKLQQSSKKDEGVFDEEFTENDVKTMMMDMPDKFIINSLQDISKKVITDNSSVLEQIEVLTKNDDHIQHIYMYMGQNLKSPKRIVGNSYFPETVDLSELVGSLNQIVYDSGVKYKELAEINCAEIPENQLQRVITYVNDCIESCVLRTTEQKQYLVSQLIENGITTWNHLQQIFSIIETCEINGGDCLTYVNLYNYVQDKSNISEMFENGKTMEALQIKMSIYRAFREWFKFHLPVEEQEQDAIESAE